ncbi:MAG: 6-pyruvoyl-tetrahydropterin synthase-related protein, partial [Anaerolineae bacterium]|nr:6-pyruvoyl-tetrahydropterin synthase-related protein [Anaerolineae bacterium]MDW8103186.1 6-pyruvoyl-tetrahydropterin synthase-related protein [Anaerolineae bacterium]
MVRERGFWLMLMGLVIVGELLTRPGLSLTKDGVVHTLRILEMHRLWEAGVFYPRWAPDLVFGLGYPLFHFNAPLFPWSGALAMELGFNPEASVKLLLALLIAFGSAGVYRLARRWGIGETGAMVAGLAYAYTPFRVRELYWLGDFPQYMGLSLLPWVLEAFHAYLREGGWPRYWFAGAMYSLLQLSHSITAMLGTIVLAGYVVLVWVAENLPLRRITRALKAFVLGIGLAAFFIFPALHDRPL